MARLFREGRVELTFPEHCQLTKLDEEIERSKLKHCMKSVDLVVEDQELMLLVEVKDPHNPKSGESTLISEYQNKVNDLLNSLVSKFRDSLLYLYMKGKVPLDESHRKIEYCVLLNLKGKPDLLRRLRKDLGERLPEGVPHGLKRALVNQCLVFDVDLWNSFWVNRRKYEARA